MPNLTTPEALSDFYFVEVQEPEAIQDMIVRLVKERISSLFKLLHQRDEPGWGRKDVCSNEVAGPRFHVIVPSSVFASVSQVP